MAKNLLKCLPYRLAGIRDYSAVSFLVCLISFPRAFLLLKLSFILSYLAIEFIVIVREKRIQIYPKILIFYGLVMGLGCIWSIIGLAYGNPKAAIADNLRLYVFWSAAYILIFTRLRAGEMQYAFHTAIILAGFIIVAVNLCGLIDANFQLGLIPESISKELEQNIGFHDGYVQITSTNIGSLFFIVPYLLALQCRKDAGGLQGRLATASLFLCFALALLSGRRALWLCLTLAPLLIGGISMLCKSGYLFRRGARTLLLSYAGCILLAPMILVGVENLIEAGPMQYLVSAFSAEDERSIQLGYLIDSFAKYPLLGSGFGGYAGYLRNYEAPWIYELTYFQLLFNFGIIGTLYILGTFSVYLYYVFKSLKRRKSSPMTFASVVGLSSFLIGVYSNPYLGSFDFLLYLGLLPFLASFSNNLIVERRSVIRDVINRPLRDV
jgi:O-antigen ligase